MTNKELREALRAFPWDAEVYYKYHLSNSINDRSRETKREKINKNIKTKKEDSKTLVILEGDRDGKYND